MLLTFHQIHLSKHHVEKTRDSRLPELLPLTRDELVATLARLVTYGDTRSTDEKPPWYLPQPLWEQKQQLSFHPLGTWHIIVLEKNICRLTSLSEWFGCLIIKKGEKKEEEKRRRRRRRRRRRSVFIVFVVCFASFCFCLFFLLVSLVANWSMNPFVGQRDLVSWLV